MRRAAGFGLLVALALPAMAGAQGVAVWCAPALVTTLVVRAPACGRPVSDLAVERAARILDAAAAAAERLQGPDAATAMRERVQVVARAGFEPETGCAALQPLLVILDRLESPRGEVMVAEQAAHAARATTLDGTCF